MKLAVSGMGALFHYAIPQAVHKLGLLGRFYTALWSGKNWGKLTQLVLAQVWPGGRTEFSLRLAFDIPILMFHYTDSRGRYSGSRKLGPALLFASRVMLLQQYEALDMQAK